MAHNLSFIEKAQNLEVRGSGEDYDNNALNLKRNAKKGPTAVVAVGPKTICNCLYNRLLIASFLADKYNCKSEQGYHQKHDVQRGVGGIARLRHCRYGGRL